MLLKDVRTYLVAGNCTYLKFVWYSVSLLFLPHISGVQYLVSEESGHTPSSASCTWHTEIQYLPNSFLKVTKLSLVTSHLFLFFSYRNRGSFHCMALSLLNNASGSYFSRKPDLCILSSVQDEIVMLNLRNPWERNRECYFIAPCSPASWSRRLHHVSSTNPNFPPPTPISTHQVCDWAYWRWVETSSVY